MGGLFSGDDCEQLVQRPVLLVANITSALLKKIVYKSYFVHFTQANEGVYCLSVKKDEIRTMNI